MYFSLQPVKNKHRDLSCEAEYLHLMLLQRLYYGLSYYANWLERGMIDGKLMQIFHSFL